MWYVLNYIPPTGHRRSALPGIIRAFNDVLLKEKDADKSHPEPLDVFAPTFISLQEVKGKVLKTEKPLLYHYVFVKGEELDVKRLCLTVEGFSFVIDRACTGRHLTVTNDTLEQFRIVAAYHSGKLPCYPLEGVNLEEGDKVQIVSGSCAGLIGTYISRKGGKSGNILVAVDGTMAVVVYDVKAEYVRVLEFARDSRRIYDQLDAYISKLQPLIAGEKVSLSDVAASTVFARRFGALKLNNPKLNAKLQVLLYAAYRIIGDRESALAAYEKYMLLSPQVTNKKTVAVIATIFNAFPPK